MKILLKKWCCWNHSGQVKSQLKRVLCTQFSAPTSFLTVNNSENNCSYEQSSNTTHINGLIKTVCFQCYDKKKPLKYDRKIRRSIRKNLQEYLQKFSTVPVTVKAFGSSVNGFGFYDADLDFYVTGMKIHKVKNLMRENREFSRISMIRSRISLIKFRHTRSGLQGDISFDNHIALENSKMLRQYSMISIKCRVLVFVMKYLAKCCCIADAYNNFISSYAYTLMVIHYLQQLKNPVLPVLQEIKPPHPSETHIQSHTVIDGNQTYFYSGDIDSLKILWPSYEANVQSIEELFIGLLKFYAFEFDFLSDVVCIHRKSPLPSEIQQMHYGIPGLLRIQDPFELKRNLGGKLLPDTNQIIKSVFCNAYDHFSKAPDRCLDNSKLMDYYFDPAVLLPGTLVIRKST